MPSPSSPHDLRITTSSARTGGPGGGLFAVLGETAADIPEPWPIKIIIDAVVQSKPLPHWLVVAVGVCCTGPHSGLNTAVAAVVFIAVLGAVSTHAEKSLTTNVSQWVAHDLRLTRTTHPAAVARGPRRGAHGDPISRVTDDIGAVQDFINSALLVIVVNVLTLVGMIAVMWYVNWRFTLIALSVAPLLFLVVYAFTRRIKAASRAVRKRESAMLSDVAEVLTSIRVVQAFAREDYEEQRFEAESLDNVKAALQARSMKARLPTLVDVIVAGGTCLVLERRASGAQWTNQRRRAHRLRAVPEQDVQADARPLEDD
jgi:subfamily B ATP-binding cassette protein MsbA